MKIAWLTPFSRRSAIGQCSAIIVRELGRRAEVTVYASDLTDPSEAWDSDVPLRLLPLLPESERAQELANYDIAIYNLGDNLAFHRTIYDAAQTTPGIVILHDLVMHHFFAGYYLVHRQQDEAGYVDEVAFSSGPEGRRFARAVLDGAAGYVWDGPQMLEHHLARSATYGAIGVITHSRFARNAVEQFAAFPVCQIPFPTPLIESSGATAGPGPAPEPDGRLRLLTYGVVNPNKMVVEVVEAIGRSPLLRDRVVYEILGDASHQSAYAQRLREAIAAAGLGEQVRLLGFQPDEVLHERLRGADIVVNLRHPHFGESSWSLLESAFMAKPTLVWRHGFYDEFPDTTVVKVGTVDEIGPALERLVADPATRGRLGAAARAYAATTFETGRYCDALLAFVEAARSARPALALADFAAQTLAELGCGAEDDLSRRIAHLVDELAGLTESV